MDFLKHQYAQTIIEIAIESELPKLNLSSKSLNEIPQNVLKCRALRKLYLQNNSIVTIPDAIGSALDNVHTLVLDGNAIHGFPDSILGMEKLRMLNISNNDIQCIPPGIRKLARLEVLWCNKAGLCALPNEIGDLRELDTFGARGNHIDHLPQTMGRLRKLRWLTLQNNRIAKLPIPFSQLKNLLHLNLRQNRLTHIPNQLYFMRKLKYCWLNDNRIEMVKDEDVERTYFMNMLNLSGNPLNVCRLLTHGSQRHILFCNDMHNLGDDDSTDDDGPTDTIWMHSVSTSTLNTDSDDWNVIRPKAPNAVIQSSKFCN